ncbi:hypothetical protein [Bordetella petrii]|uniref:hypothetical protein n=1 Tax=Bordetella petrii TaxID=94624 RepID=UPI001244B28A|nr:hypothetical protein [Bordetella petrii]
MKVLYKKPVLSASPLCLEQATSHFTARRAGRLENSFHALEIGHNSLFLLYFAEKQQAAAEPPATALALSAACRRQPSGA